ncbi:MULTISPECIES: hypothetical protein [unclassified Streptomyces]|uniref:hypothetical protein n=1 Tax=unclassified Streptomyces TaxID=2593676 RepID=UPI003D90EA7C
MSTLTPAIFGLVGTGVGAALSFAGTWFAQVKSDKRSSDERAAARQQGAASAIAQAMYDVAVHVRALPQDSEGRDKRKEWESTQQDAWVERLNGILGPLTIHVEAMQDPELRDSLREAFRLIERWDLVREHLFTEPRPVVEGIAGYVISLLGAYQRGDPAPAAAGGLHTAREAWEKQAVRDEKYRQWEAEWRAKRQAEQRAKVEAALAARQQPELDA